MLDYVGILGLPKGCLTLEVLHGFEPLKAGNLTPQAARLCIFSTFDLPFDSPKVD